MIPRVSEDGIRKLGGDAVLESNGLPFISTHRASELMDSKVEIKRRKWFAPSFVFSSLITFYFLLTYASTFCFDFFFDKDASDWKTILLSFTSTVTTAPSLNLPPSSSTESGLSTYFWMARRRGRAPKAGS